MPKTISGYELLENLAPGSATREALLDPDEGFFDNVGTAYDTVKANVLGLGENVVNLGSNIGAIGSFLGGGAVPDVYLNVQDLLSKDYTSVGAKAWDVSKAMFGENTQDEFSQYVTGLAEPARQEVDRQKAISGELGQFGSGGTGRLVGELISAAPLMKVGNLSKIGEAYKAGLTGVDMAKAVTINTAENVLKMGSSEFALAKAYGQTDAEAVNNAVYASLFALGTPAVMGVAKGAKKVQEAGEEAMAQSAGGGRPPEPTQRYSDGSTPTWEQVDEYSEYKNTIDEIVKDTDLPEDIRRNFAKELRLMKMYEDRGRIPTKEEISGARIPEEARTPQTMEKDVPKQYVSTPIEDVKASRDMEAEAISIEKAQANDVQNPIGSDEIPVGDNPNSFEKITPADTPEEVVKMERAADDFDTATPDEKISVGSFKFDADQATQAAKQLDDESRILTEEETILRKSADSTELPPRSMFEENVTAFVNNLRDQVGTDPRSQSFNKLFTNRRFKMDEVNIRAERLKNEFDRLMVGEDGKMWDDYFLKTDVHAIREMDRESARAFVNQHRNIYEQAKRYIDQSAKAVGDDSQQIGSFMNNPKLIAEHLNMSTDVVPIINKLISIKAMELKGGRAAWEFLDAKRDTEAFKFAMDVISNNKRVSHQLFRTNPSKIVKGYVAEPFSGGKQIVGGKIKYDAETGFEPGAIPSNLEGSKVGEWMDKDELREAAMDGVQGDTMSIRSFNTKEELEDYALEKGFKITDKGFRKVTPGELRDKAGRVHDFATRLTDTTTSIDAKVANKEVIDDILEQVSNDDVLISVRQKPGFRELTAEERSNLPYELRDKIRFVDADYADKLLGREEVRIYKGEKQVGKIADRLVKDLVTNFKQNVVLKNLSSYKNAILVNQTIGTMAGVSPAKLVKYQREAMTESTKLNEYRNILAKRKATGQSTEAVEEAMSSVLLYRMEKAGLSLNKLDGVRGDSTLLANMLSDATGHRFDKIANEILLNQKGETGKVTMRVFSEIDTMGRYSVAKNYLDKGMTMKEAVKRANGLYGDMDRMAPAMVEAIDAYGAVPFLKWFTFTSPMLMKIAKENPKTATAIAVSMYAISAETGVNLSSVNPLEAMVDFADSAVTLDYIRAVRNKGLQKATIRKMTPFVVPNYMRDIYRKSTRENYEVLWKDRMEKPKWENSTDYRGLTQQLIEGD